MAVRYALPANRSVSPSRFARLTLLRASRTVAVKVQLLASLPVRAAMRFLPRLTV